MKVTRLWIPAVTFALAFGVGANAWPQTTESETTTTTAPAVPSVESRTVTRKTVVNPPPVVVNPPAESTETTTTESTTPERPVPTVQEKKESRTTLGPLGVTHSEKHEESSDD
jgi:hypothetical protein